METVHTDIASAAPSPLAVKVLSSAVCGQPSPPASLHGSAAARSATSYALRPEPGDRAAEADDVALIRLHCTIVRTSASLNSTLKVQTSCTV